MAMPRGYKEKWVPPPISIDDWIYELAVAVWYYEHERAREIAIWLMKTKLGDQNG